MLHTVSVFSYTVRLHNLSLRHHCHLSVCTVLTKYTKVCLLSYLGLILSIVYPNSYSIILQQVHYSSPVYMQNFMLSCTNEIRCSLSAGSICSASSSWLSQLLKTCIPQELTRKTLRGTQLQLEKAVDTDDVQPLPRIARSHHSQSQYISYFTARMNREKSEVYTVMAHNRERTIIGSVSYRNWYWVYRIESYRLL